jgi:hypothetical protein
LDLNSYKDLCCRRRLGSDQGNYAVRILRQDTYRDTEAGFRRSSDLGTLDELMLNADTKIYSVEVGMIIIPV